MTKDEFQVVEAILALFPELCRAADERRDYVVSLALSLRRGEPVQGGAGVSPIERFAEGDEEGAKLKTVIDRIAACLGRLGAEDGKFVELYYFEGRKPYDFDESESTLYGRRRRICAKLGGVIAIYPLVREWREKERARGIAAAKTAAKTWGG